MNPANPQPLDFLRQALNKAEKKLEQVEREWEAKRKFVEDLEKKLAEKNKVLQTLNQQIDSLNARSIQKSKEVKNLDKHIQWEELVARRTQVIEAHEKLKIEYNAIKAKLTLLQQESDMDAEGASNNEHKRNAEVEPVDSNEAKRVQLNN
jgi:chromosome segregation ATPase